MTRTQLPHRTARSARLAVALVAAVLGVPVVAGPAFAAGADPTPAVATSAPGPVIATDPTTTAAPAALLIGVDANVVEGLSVTGHGGRTVTVTTAGQSARSITAPATKAAVFRHLTPGRAYAVAIGGMRVGTATPVAQVSPATGLVVRATTVPGQVELTWQHTRTRATGGPRISYDLTATPLAASSARTAAVVSGTASTTTASLAGLDPAALYTITVTPRNSAGTGRPTAATMTASLAQITGTAVPTTTPAAPVPVPADVPASPSPAAPAPAPGPAPAPAPATKTIYICPAGYPENSAGVCEKTTPYTYSTTAYTYHQQATGPMPILDTYETAIRACPSGYNFEDYGWVMYCRLYGPAPTATVKDPTPAGATDTGTAWTRKDTLPAGYADNGAAWVQTAAKVATVVPA